MRMLIVIALLAVAACSKSDAASFAMAPYKEQCNEADRLYASCLEQTTILEAGLASARAAHKPAAIIFGFNDCPPCNTLEAWLHTDAGKAAIAPYTLIELSIFDPERNIRPEVYEKIIPEFNLPINNTSPYGVPHFVIVDPATRRVMGEGLIGFDSEDPGAYVSYLAAHARN